MHLKMLFMMYIMIELSPSIQRVVEKLFIEANVFEIVFIFKMMMHFKLNFYEIDTSKWYRINRTLATV